MKKNVFYFLLLLSPAAPLFSSIGETKKIDYFSILEKNIINRVRTDTFRKNLRVALNEKFNVNEKGKDKKTLLHRSVSFGKREITELLLEEKADINAQDYCDATPLHLALLFGSVNMLKLLLRNNPNIRLKDSFGRSAFHQAALGNKKEIIELLIEHAKLCDFNIQQLLADKDKYDKTPFDCATTRDIIEYLQEIKAQSYPYSTSYFEMKNAINMEISNGNKSLLCLFTKFESKIEGSKEQLHILLPTEQNKRAQKKIPVNTTRSKRAVQTKRLKLL